MLIIKNKSFKNHETNCLYTDDLTDAVQTVDGKLHFNLSKRDTLNKGADKEDFVLF